MNVSALLRSLRSDLRDRRLLPVLVLLGLALAGAVAYAALAGGGSPQPVAAALAPTVAAKHAPAVTVTEAPANPHAAVSETTEGAHYQHHGGSHDPFMPLVSPHATSTTSVAVTRATTASESKSASGSGSSGTSTSSTSSAPSPGGGGTTPSHPSTPAPKPKPKPKPQPTYAVNLQFGPLPTPPAELKLTPYTVHARRPLPSASDPWLVYTGVHGTPSEAAFTLTREAILKGPAVCTPSTLQCEAIALPAGQSEQLEYLEASGQSVVYELKVLTITRVEAATARIARRHRHHRRHHHR